LAGAFASAACRARSSSSEILVVAVFLANFSVDWRVVVTDAGAQIKLARAAESRGDLVGASESRQEESGSEERGR
jgi:hypothetical protein